MRLYWLIPALLTFGWSFALHAQPPNPDDRAAWHAVLHWPDECEGKHRATDPDRAGIVLHQLAPERWLVEVLCALGAYQGSRMFYVWDATVSPPTAKGLAFLVYENGIAAKKRHETEVWGDVEFVAKGSQLVIFSRFRAQADCGWRAAYRIERVQAVLLDFVAKPKCDGDVMDPDRWKRVNQSH